MSAVLKPASGSATHFSPMAEPDLERVLVIERAIYDFPWTRGNFRDSLRAGYSCWTARADGAVVGYAVMMRAGGGARVEYLSRRPAPARRPRGRAPRALVGGRARARRARVI